MALTLFTKKNKLYRTKGISLDQDCQFIYYKNKTPDSFTMTSNSQ